MPTNQTYSDIIKKSFMDLHSGSLTISDIGTVLIVTFLTACFIFLIYKKTFKGVLYTHSYNISLVMISLVTALVIMTISTNLVLSLGMVGALSIVRFRTAVKDPMDIAFMFWSIAVGIANGALYFQISVIGSLFIGLIMLGFSKIKLVNNPFLIILHYNIGSESTVKDELDGRFKNFKIKSKTMSGDQVELTIETRVPKSDLSFANALNEVKEINNVMIVSYDGNYVS